MRLAAVNALRLLEKRLPSGIMEQLAERLKDDNDRVRVAAIQALSEETSPAEAIDKLTVYSQTDSSRTHGDVIEALSKLGERFPEYVIESVGRHLQSGDAEVSALSYAILQRLYQRGVELPKYERPKP